MALSREELQEKLRPWLKGATGSSSDLDPKILDKIIAGTHGSFTPEGEVREGADIHFNYDSSGNQIVKSPTRDTTRDTSTRSRNDMRRELLLPDYRKQAAQQVNPQFDRLTNQLRSQIAATRGRIPRQLLARGQAVGGQRTLQEGELDRQLAYGTADLEAQRQMAINQVAQGLRQQGLEQQRWETEQQFKERQLASDENRWQQDFEYGQEQDAFNNYVQQRKLELEEQGMSFDQAQAQAEFEYEQNRDAINDDFRRWQTSMMYGGRGTSGTGGTATPQEDSFDINPYMDRIENGGYLNDPQALIQYINTRDIPESAKQQLRNLYGVTQRTSDLGLAGQTRPEYKYEAITPKVEPEPVDYPMSYVEAKEDVLSTATDMNGNVNAEIVAQQVDALVAAGQISPDVAMAIYSPYAQQE